jgi:hypothetical protein
MITVILSHEVKNFTDWKKAYDGDAENRAKSGMNIRGVYTSVENPNLVTVIGEVSSVEVIKGFMANPELKAAMEKGGVISAPDVRILSRVQ